MIHPTGIKDEALMQKSEYPEDGIGLNRLMVGIKILGQIKCFWAVLWLGDLFKCNKALEMHSKPKLQGIDIEMM